MFMLEKMLIMLSINIGTYLELLINNQLIHVNIKYCNFV